MLFDVATPLEFRVHTTIAYWDLLIRVKHPVMPAASEKLKRHCVSRIRLGEADLILKSTSSIERYSRGDGIARWPGGKERVDFSLQRIQLIESKREL